MNWEPTAERMWKGTIIVIVSCLIIVAWKFVLALLLISPVIYGAGWLFDKIFSSR